MFTGLVQGVGRIVEAARSPGFGTDGGMRLSIDAGGIAGLQIAVGDSVAIAGACMTAIRVEGTSFAVDISKESLARTTGLDKLGDVNIETSLRLGDKLGGHLLAGHVDGVGEVVEMSQVHESWQLVVRVAAELARYLAYKGSVAIDGVSLTVNWVSDGVRGCEFAMNIIPHTYRATTLGALRVGDGVNVEADLIARYVERMLSPGLRSA